MLPNFAFKPLDRCPNLYPATKNCKNCRRPSSTILSLNDNIYYYCELCKMETAWNEETTLSRMKISMTTLELLIYLFTENRTVNQAFHDLKLYLAKETISEKTVYKYFKMFSQIALKYYAEAHHSTILEGEIEVDESQLYKPKKSKADGRPYVYSSVWLIGFRERNSQRFLVFPTKDRSAQVFIPLLLSHVRTKSLIYSDSYSVYVNNHVFPARSKLIEWGYRHRFVNHKIEFVNGIFKDMHTNTVERQKIIFIMCWSLFFSSLFG